MSAFTVEFKDDAIRRALTELSALLSDLTPEMQEIGEVLTESTKERFASGTGPDGTPWAKKSQATIEAYRARGDPVSLKPLIGPTRALSTTIHHAADRDSVTVGSNAIQAAVMQFGASKAEFGARTPWDDIPARPFLGLSAEDEANISAVLAEAIGRAMGS